MSQAMCRYASPPLMTPSSTTANTTASSRMGRRQGYELVRLAGRSAISLHFRVEQADGDRFRTVRDPNLLRFADEDLAAAWVKRETRGDRDRTLPTSNHLEA